MRDYITLHLDTNYHKGAACSKKVYRRKWTRETIYLTLHFDTDYSKGAAYSKKGYGYKWTSETI